MWLHRINLKDLLDDDDSAEHAKEVGRAVAERLRKSCLFTGADFAERFEGVADCGHFNAIMSQLYNYCDQHRIWVE